MIEVLCASCNTHLMNTDVARLDWPLTGEMMDVIYPGWWLRPGLLNLDIFCPCCSSFPFFWDGSVPGAVGKNLNIRGADGKPEVLAIKQILMGRTTFGAVQEKAAKEGKEIVFIDNRGVYAAEFGTPEIPMPAVLQAPPLLPGASLGRELKPASCPSCGAKPGRGGVVTMHRKGCPVITAISISTPESQQPRSSVDMDEKEIAELESVRKKREVAMPIDRHRAEIESRVKSGPDREDTPPTPGELAEIERSRQARQEKNDPKLRPGEGYAPKPRG